MWIVVINPAFLSFVRRCFPQTRVHLHDTVDIARLDPVDVLGLNGPLEVGTNLPHFGSVILVDWNLRTRPFRKWFAIARSISHTRCGGVSNFCGVFKVLVHHACRASFLCHDELLGDYPRADIGALLDCRVSGTEVSISNTIERLNPPQVTRVGRLFHPRGLFPCDVLQPEFLAPCVFVSSKWVRRPLSLSERLLVFDLPVVILKSLTSREQRLLLSCLSVPLKCYSALTSGLFLTANVTIEEDSILTGGGGGGVVFGGGGF